MISRKSVLGATLLLLAGACTGAFAQDHDHDRGGRGGWDRGGYGHGGARFDGRYNHNHYYPARGFIAATLPYGALSVGFGGGNYFFHGGVWWRPYNGSYIVVAPPVGIYAPILPPDYVTLSIGGQPYYYADGTYYSQQGPGQGYEVVDAPPGADTAQPTVAQPAVAQPSVAPPPASPDPIIYPRNGQSAAQTEADRRDCNTWATSQPNAMADARVFQRSVDACMDGHGYTVR